MKLGSFPVPHPFEQQNMEVEMGMVLFPHFSLGMVSIKKLFETMSLDYETE